MNLTRPSQTDCPSQAIAVSSRPMAKRAGARQAVRERLLGPGSLVEGLLFVGGVTGGMSCALGAMLRDLAPEARSRMLSGWTFPLAMGWWAMAVAFEGAQRRQVHLDLLSPRRAGVIGSLVAGMTCGMFYVGLCLMEPLFEWLPAPFVLIVGACSLSFMASRALWKKQSS